MRSSLQCEGVRVRHRIDWRCRNEALLIFIYWAENSTDCESIYRDDVYHLCLFFVRRFLDATMLTTAYGTEWYSAE